MAPSASMLFLSYPKLHDGPTEAPHNKDASGAGTGGFRFGLSNVFFSLPKRRDAAAAVSDDGKRGARRAGGGEGDESATLAGKFDEAVRLSCWAS